MSQTRRVQMLLLSVASIYAWRAATYHSVKIQRYSDEVKSIPHHTPKAFSDALQRSGFNGSVQCILEGSEEHYITVSKVYGGTKQAVFFYTPRFLVETTPQEQYAIAGHEAIHLNHHHYLLRKIAHNYLMLQYPVALLASYRHIANRLPQRLHKQLGCIAFSLFAYAGTHPWQQLTKIFDASISKLCEVDADISSSLKLGTAHVLTDYFVRYAGFRATIWDTHPSTATRIRYLTFIHRHFPSKPQKENKKCRYCLK